jgi:hypothetical protein
MTYATERRSIARRTRRGRPGGRVPGVEGRRVRHRQTWLSIGGYLAYGAGAASAIPITTYSP